MTVHAKSNLTGRINDRKLITLARANKTPQLQTTRMLFLMTVFCLFLSPTMACKGTLLSTYVCDLNPVYVSVYLHQLRYDILWYFPFVLHELPCDMLTNVCSMCKLFPPVNENFGDPFYPSGNLRARPTSVFY